MGSGRVNEKGKKLKALLRNKNFVLSMVLVLAVAGVGYANYAVTHSADEEIVGTGADAAEEIAAQDVFANYRAERTSARAEEISYIDSVVSSEAGEDVKNDAQKQKLELVSNMEAELTTEGVIKTTMLMDAVVTVRDDAVNVVVNKAELSENEVAQIAEIVKTQTGQTAQNIKIMPQVNVE